MSNHIPPIRPPKREEQERVSMPAIEAKKEIKEKFAKEKERQKGGFFLLTFFVSVLQKVLDLFVTDSQQNRPSQNKALKQLRAHFKTMSESDKSQDIPFIQELSHCWERLLSGDPTPLTELKKCLRSYRGEAPKSFAYYLEEHAGDQWFPLPFMEMIQALHREFEAAPQSATLTQWIALIDELILFRS